MTRTDRRTLARQLAEEGLSQRAIAKRLGVSKDTVRRDLERIAGEAEPERAPDDEPQEPDAPQAGDGDATGSEAAGAPDDAPVARLPRRVAQPLGGVDLSRWPAVRRDLAVLAQTGRSAEASAHQAITALAHHYSRALTRGEIQPGQQFTVTHMTLRPLPQTPALAVPAAGGS